MIKTIVTHFAPDVDAVSSVWLLKRFLPGWDEAKVEYVAAGKTFNNEIVDSNPDILHVDTGMGMLDHHQTGEDTCAAKRTLDYINRQQATGNRQKLSSNNNFSIEALERLVEVVNDIDHFREVYFPNPTADYYDFNLVSILDGLKLLYSTDNNRILEAGMICMDGIYKTFQNKVWAERELKEKGVPFKTRWGKGLGIESVNDEAVRLAQKTGYVLAVRKDPKKEFIRIKALPQSGADLTACYHKLKKLDTKATWFLHAGKKMLLNGSVKNPESRPSKLSLKEVIDVLRKA